MNIELTKLIDAVVDTIRTHADELTELDQAIGDGDHGINMKRGFEAIAELQDELNDMNLSEALQKIGMTLVMKIGGASGPLYGTLFMQMGKSIPENIDENNIATAFANGVEAVGKRGKSEPGQKTMLDVLVPVSDAFQKCANEQTHLTELLQRIVQLAQESLDATKPMLAKKGRASFLGERSIGHLDPGAMSSFLIIKAISQTLEGKI